MDDGGGIIGAWYVIEGRVIRKGRGGVWEKDDVRVGPCEREGWDVSNVGNGLMDGSEGGVWDEV